MDVWIVDLDGERRALPAGAPCELLHLDYLTPVPTAPPVVRGVIQVRGQVVPVVDLRAPPERALHPGTPLVLIEVREGLRVALVVDRVHERAEESTADARPLDLAAALATLRPPGGR
ncbi:MAG: hypothetical protein EXR72_13905 [Myxococcales bacterium]|nr:hypothetical protein [Myxococcales bacterium]